MDRRGCGICDTLSLSDLTDLDLFMGDASKWPSTIWGIFDPPKGRLSPRRQWVGGTNAGRLWLDAHGHRGEFSRKIVANHYRYDVVVVAANAADLLNRGVIVASHGNGQVTEDAIDPARFLTYFAKGIDLGITGIEKLAVRVAEMDQKSEEIPTSLLLKMADIGAKLATTVATIKGRGGSLDPPDESDEGFRAGSVEGGIPSKRMGHQRIRVIDGEARPVTDEGPADRAHFDERSKAEGGSGMPH